MRIAALAMGLWLAIGPVVAHEATIDDQIRAYILANPEIILEAMDILAERETQNAIAASVARHPDLFSDPARLGLGQADAPIRVVEFFDYRCAPCKAMHSKLAALVADQPDLRIEMRQLPILSPGSERAARFALAVYEMAGAQAYARVHDKLWHLKGPLSAASFEKIAKDEGLDFAQLDPLTESAAVSARIDANRASAIDLGILGTPGFIARNDVSYGGGAVDALAARWLSR